MHAHPMRTLIIGAGVAGLSLSALMQQRGEKPTVIERSETLGCDGYVLGLFPLGSRIFHGLGLYSQYMEKSKTMCSYEIRSDRGKLIRKYDLIPVTERYGPIQGLGRDTLIELLLEKVDESAIRTGTTVTELKQKKDTVEVHFSDDTSGEFDLVVAADGMHSDTRSLMLERHEFEYRETGFGGWVFWAGVDGAMPDGYTEYWGAGRFLGTYPTQNKLGVFIGGITDGIQALGAAATAAEFQKNLNCLLPALDAVPENSFFWNFHDCRVKHWRNGRVILLGDAAAGFLPTAGVGASMAMESAAALNDELSRTNAKRVASALALYEKRHRRRVEKAQTSSRRLGNWMTIKSRPVAQARNQLLRFYTVEQLVRDIAKIMDEPI